MGMSPKCGRNYIIAAMRRALLIVIALWAASQAAADEPPARRARPFLRGVALSLHDDDPELGSELSWSQGRGERWRALIAKVRRAFPGELTYSANWDDYENVGFWDALDLVGLSGYYELAPTPGASTDVLRAAWSRERDRILAW